MKRIIAALAVTLVAAMAPGTPAHAGDPEKGKKVFNRCKSCHMVGENASTRVGPVLNGLIGRPAGSVEGYKYSKLNRAAGMAGLVWGEENLVPYLEDPTKYLKAYLKDNGKADQAKGRSKMAYKLRKAADAEDVIAYLKQFSGQP